MSKYTVDNLPEDALPELDELSGDLRILAEVVGVRDALRISERFDSTPIRVYGYKKWVRAWRDQQIRKEYDNGGISQVNLARKYGMSDRHICNILGMEPGEERQLRLF
jgi:hypothetical protein